MFGFSRRRMKLGRLKVHLSDPTQGTRSPIRHIKRGTKSIGEEIAPASSNSDELNCQHSPAEAELNNCTSGNSESWMVLSTAGDKPIARFNHAATVIGDKMVVVGGESGHGLLDDVQVLNFEKFTWTTASSKLYLSPTSLPLKSPACKGHCLVTWGKKALLIGGKTDPESDKLSAQFGHLIQKQNAGHFLKQKGKFRLTVVNGVNYYLLVFRLDFHLGNSSSSVARSGHTVIRAGSVLILFGGEDAKRRKLNDLHMFDLKSLMWLPLHCTGTGPSPRSNHVAALHDDRILYIFGGTSKSRTLNDLYSLDFETMIWSRIKIRGFHPSPRAGCCGVLCGYKWYIAGGGSRKKRHMETLVFDVLKVEWSVVVASPPSSITTNKGFSLVIVQHKEKVFLVAFGGCKKEPSSQVEVLMMEKNENSMGQRTTLDQGSCPLAFANRSYTIKLAAHIDNEARPYPIDSVARHNLASVLDHHGSSRRSISESCLLNSNPVSGNVSLRKQFHNEGEYNVALKILQNIEGEKSKGVEDCSILKTSSIQETDQKTKSQDTGVQTDISVSVSNAEEIPFIFEDDLTKAPQKHLNGNLDKEDRIISETDGSSAGLHQAYETKMSTLARQNGILEGQLAAALASREAADKNLHSVTKSKQDVEKTLAETFKELELLKEKLASLEVAQEESNNLSNIVHSDNVRLEHDVAFLKAVLDDTQKELHSTRGVLAGERARAFQLQVFFEVVFWLFFRSATMRLVRWQFEEERLPILNEKKRNGLEVETSETRRFSHQRSVRRLRSELHSVNQHSRPLPWRRLFRPSGFNGKEEIEERVLRWRASIYNRRLQALPLPSKNLPEQDTSRSSIFKERMQCRIKPWIQRELRAILQDPDPSVIVHLATSLYMLSLEEKLKASSEHVDLEDKFVKQLRPFLQDHTNLFWHELRLGEVYSEQQRSSPCWYWEPIGARWGLFMLCISISCDSSFSTVLGIITDNISAIPIRIFSGWFDRAIFSVLEPPKNQMNLLL
ncbi:hypothetical protein IFM89_016481 [Coptis chinensis]|uniref:Acyl-CoA-binding domain-containing protein 4 n=1 Tax=Coptis chinensis TaxID=261450 RepID=A0A835HV55_9MAGN|nr:hypothetical protein IFM89_016481 [Coptis chinensis]